MQLQYNLVANLILLSIPVQLIIGMQHVVLF